MCLTSFYGRPQGPHPAHVGIHALFVCLTSFCGRPLPPPSRALHPSVIHALFIRLTADVRHPHIAYGRRMKLSSRCSSVCRARPLWPSAKHHYICHGRPQGPHPAHVGIHALFVCLTSFCGRPLTPPSRALHPSVIHALFIRLTADVRHPHIAYGRRMKLSSRCSSVCRARPLWPSVIYIYDGVLRTAPNPA